MCGSVAKAGSKTSSNPPQAPFHRICKDSICCLIRLHRDHTGTWGAQAWSYCTTMLMLTQARLGYPPAEDFLREIYHHFDVLGHTG
jgi:hypothetical protein